MQNVDGTDASQILLDEADAVAEELPTFATPKRLRFHGPSRDARRRRTSQRRERVAQPYIAWVAANTAHPAFGALTFWQAISQVLLQQPILMPNRRQRRKAMAALRAVAR